MINTIVIMGRLTADPELKTTSTGIEVTSFTVAVDRRYRKQGEEKQTDFLPVVAFRQTAAFITKYFAKGQMIAVEGHLQSRRYEDKDGNPRTAYDIIANNVSFCGSKSESGTTYQASETGNLMDVAADDDDDLPFN